LASVGFLAAGVAHEINNPLASIAMCAESLQGRLGAVLDPGDERHRVVAQYLQMVQDEAFRCKGITEQLLDFSRVGQTTRQKVELGELVQDVVGMVGHLGRYQGKRVEFDHADPVALPVNVSEIKQVVLNLLTNALDSLDERGDDRGLVRIRLRQRDNAAELSVIDNGGGIAPDVLEHVFEPFFTRRRAGQGTGLGLSISYRIIADHGGQLTAESPGVGRGATFTVRLPLKPAENDACERLCRAA
jgi:signal transduction histidine kinase